MKLFVALMKYDYGVVERGFSYEYYNIYLPLCDVYGAGNVLLFDYFAEVKKSGKIEMNKKLKDAIKNEKPDVSLFCLFTYEFDEDTLISLKEFTKTVVYFFDDPWRQNFVRYWIEYFDYFTTPDFYMWKQYELEGFKNVIYSPFGFNPSIYKTLDLEKIYDVSFVGAYNPYRRWVINLLRKQGIKINVFGRFWNNKSWISQEDMVKIFNQSKINLNLSNAISYDFRFLFHSLTSLEAMKQIYLVKKNKEQIKGRHYEINGCGGFQLSYFVPGLNLAYEIDKEIVVFENPANIAGQVKFFLNNEDLRNEIAQNGYNRSQKEHQAQFYLERMIKTILK